MNWLLNILSEISSLVAGDELDGDDRERRRHHGDNDNDGPGGTRTRVPANDEGRRRDRQGDTVDWDW